MSSTALGAEKVREIIFISDAHEKFYYEKLKEVRCQDVYHKALCYCLGISNDTRKNIVTVIMWQQVCGHKWHYTYIHYLADISIYHINQYLYI